MRPIFGGIVPTAQIPIELVLLKEPTGHLFSIRLMSLGTDEVIDFLAGLVESLERGAFKMALGRRHFDIISPYSCLGGLSYPIKREDMFLLQSFFNSAEAEVNLRFKQANEIRQISFNRLPA